MSTTLYAFPTAGSQTLRALSRHPSRAAFVWDGGSISYRAAAEVIGQMQKVFVNSGLERGHRVAILTANRAEAWCAGVAAQLCAAGITWLHPLGSLDDQLNQIEDSEASAAVFDVKAFRERGGELAARATRLKTVFTLGPAEYGGDLLSAIEEAGSTTPVDLARPDDVASLNYGRHYREVEGGAAAPPRVRRLRLRHPCRLRYPRGPPLPCRRAHQPCRRHEDPARTDAWRQRAFAHSLRPRSDVCSHRPRPHQFHPPRSNHDLCSPGSPEARTK